MTATANIQAFVVKFGTEVDRNSVEHPINIVQVHTREGLLNQADVFALSGWVGYHTGNPPTKENKVLKYALEQQFVQ
ncbi:MAG TPA: hypothetical protein VLI92_01125 [Candidatus Saccharimonadales bacterium]|nr:hypothetical protein [Candidatus Saccharimonadales bacterium]